MESLILVLFAWNKLVKIVEGEKRGAEPTKLTSRSCIDMIGTSRNHQAVNPEAEDITAGK